MLRPVFAASLIACLCLPSTDAFAPTLPCHSTTTGSLHPQCNLRSASAPREFRLPKGVALKGVSLPRREVLGLLPAGLALLAPGVAWGKGGPAGGGTGDPKDKAKIEGMLATLEVSLVLLGLRSPGVGGGPIDFVNG